MIKKHFISLCKGYLHYMRWLGKGAIAWSGMALMAWFIASVNGKLLVVSPTPSLENKVFLIERLDSDLARLHFQHLKGQVLAVCLEDKQIQFAEQNNFNTSDNIAARWLGCDKGAWIKRVAAVGGDIVTINNGMITVNGAPISVIPKMESDGEIYSVYAGEFEEGTFHLNETDVFLVGDHNLSFDSRYVGLFDLNQLKGRVTHAL